MLLKIRTIESLFARVSWFAWAGNASRHFRINLSSRHRRYVAPARFGLMGLSAFLLLGILWNCGQAVLRYRDVHSMRAELERAKQQDRQLLAEAGQEGIEL